MARRNNSVSPQSEVQAAPHWGISPQKPPCLSLMTPLYFEPAFVSFALPDEHYGSDISPLTWKNESEAERSLSSF
jgi:hypothetical protein